MEAAGWEQGREHGVTGGEGPGTEQGPVLTLRVRDGVPPGIRSFLCLVLQDKSLDSSLKFIDIYLNYSNMFSGNRTCTRNWEYRMTGGFVGLVCFCFSLQLGSTHTPLLQSWKDPLAQIRSPVWKEILLLSLFKVIHRRRFLTWLHPEAHVPAP